MSNRELLTSRKIFQLGLRRSTEYGVAALRRRQFLPNS
jgi:hypothetical protein